VFRREDPFDERIGHLESVEIINADLPGAIIARVLEEEIAHAIGRFGLARFASLIQNPLCLLRSGGNQNSLTRKDATVRTPPTAK